jgi:hypothetical protein
MVALLPGEKMIKTALTSCLQKKPSGAISELNPAGLAEHESCAIAWFTVFFLEKRWWGSHFS